MRRERCVIFQWVVNDPDTSRTGMLIEQLRYAGIVSIVKQEEHLNEITYMLEMKAPRGVDGATWAFQNAQRMKSFGINAEDTWRELC